MAILWQTVTFHILLVVLKNTFLGKCSMATALQQPFVNMCAAAIAAEYMLAAAHPRRAKMHSRLMQLGSNQARPYLL